MPRRIEHTSGTDWEAEFGYARAVRVDNTVRVSGTVAVEDGETVAPNDPYGQASHIFEVVDEALDALDASPEDVVVTRVYVVDFDDWEPIGRAHREFFGDVKPATTLLEVASLPAPDLCLEIEVEAVAKDA
ncbi:RidA family protein [Halolamina litorea]|uniref:Rid family hydrolase n=1 Tax=Halolamina litorea TaxID=1515593 RepID=A0ABD6BVX6_9EURY|nr:Rid family hydrolase [Halolamina litorea]